MTRSQYNAKAEKIQQEAQRRTDERFYYARTFWDSMKRTNPIAYKAEQVYEFQHFRREVIREYGKM